MVELLGNIGQLGVLIFIVSSMLSMGLAHDFREVVKPLQNVRGVIAVLLANFVVVPAITLVVLHYAVFDISAKIGLFLFASSAGAAFVIKYVEIAEGDLALAVSLLLVLMPATVVYLPFVIPLVLPEVTVSAGAIATPLIWTLLLPLGAGLVAEALFPEQAQRAQPWVARVSSVALVVLVVALLVSNIPEIVAILGTGVLPVAALITLVGFGSGYVIGGNRSDVRKVVAFGTAQKNVAAALVVASQVFVNDYALVVIIVSSLLGIVLLLAIAFGMRHRVEKKRERGEEPRPLTYREV